jgi:hypothetical protein
VAYLYAAYDARAQVVSSIPFTVWKWSKGKITGKDLVDDSDDWNNVLGFVNDPSTFSYMTEAAAELYGAAYWRRNANPNKIVKALQYFRPDSITPDITKDPITFERKSDTAPPKTYKPDDLLYFWPPDPEVELGPAVHYPLVAAAKNAEVLSSLSTFATRYLRGGGAKATILTVPANTQPKDAEETKSRLRDIMSGATQWFETLFNQDVIKPVTIGEGLGDLADTDLSQEAKQDILTAFRIPHSILMSDAANYATALSDDKNFMSKVAVPRARWIWGVVNEQIVHELGYHVTIEQERLDAFQEEEKDKSAAFTSYAGAFAADPEMALVAAQITGVDIPSDALTLIDERIKTVGEAELTPEQKQLKNWERKAVKRLKEKRDAVAPFVSDILPTSLMSEIAESLRSCRDADEVRAVFGRVDAPTAIPVKAQATEPAQGAMMLAMALNRLADVEAMKAIPAPLAAQIGPPVVVNTNSDMTEFTEGILAGMRELIAHIASLPAPIVNMPEIIIPATVVNVPEMAIPAPVVNFTAPPSSAGKPPDVIINPELVLPAPRPKRITLIKDKITGQIIGADIAEKSK